MDRRSLIKALMGFSVSGLSIPLSAQGEDFRRLVVIELQGGNDGLNTLIPYSDPQYSALRPRLSIPKDRLITLSDNLALHPAMSALLPVWQAEQLAIINGVGYEKPNRSHFKGIKIWNHGNKTFNDNSGWLNSYSLLKQELSPTGAVVFGQRNEVVGSNLDSRFIGLNHLDQFIKKHLMHRPGVALSISEQKIRDIHNGISGFIAKVNQAGLPQSNAVYPKHKFGQWLDQTDRLIKTELQIPIFKLHLNGFDTHANQADKHEKLLTTFSDGLAAFRDSLIKSGHWDNTLVMTYSEFGRRAKENGSYGTDHGTSAPHFVMGGKVKGGFYGDQPSLIHLVNDDLDYTVDFRSYYNAVLKHWLNQPELMIEPLQYKPLVFV